MALTANLKVQLLADDVLVAESEDKHLWRRVLGAIQGSGDVDGPDTDDQALGDTDQDRGLGDTNDPILAFAKELSTSVEDVRGACDPILDAPYIHLDPKSWEAFKRNTPSRGSNAVGPVQLAATLLVLWFKAAGIEGRPTQSQAQAVLGTIGIRDKNASRSVKHCEWLQNRNNGVQINAARYSRALAIAASYVTSQPAGT